MAGEKRKFLRIRNLIRGASTLLLGGMATNVPAATLSNIQEAEWNAPDQQVQSETCAPEILALADLGALPGTYEGCISELGIELEDLVSRLPTHPSPPGTPPNQPYNRFLRGIHHKPGHYDGGGGGNDCNAGGGNDSEEDENGEDCDPGNSGGNNNAGD